MDARQLRMRTYPSRSLVSDRAWEQGLGTFFYDGVPFSFSTGTAFATAISQFIHALYADKETLYIEELGAGLGLLSVHLLQALETSSPMLFQKTKLPSFRIRWRLSC